VTVLTSPNAGTTEDAGYDLARRLRAGDIVLLEGDLAAGKTTFVHGMLRGLGGSPDDVSSPTFVLVQSYPCDFPGISTLHHVDLYRLADDLPDLRELGLQESLSDVHGVVAVEWPRNALAAWIPDDARVIRVEIRFADDDVREIEIANATS
jgi:tRNA threonylcarbamoyladenosine biosynthesis protein TsaE